MKKLLSFDNPILVNIFILMLISMLVSIIIGIPIVMIGLKINPNVFEDARKSVLGVNSSEYSEMVYSLRTYIEYFWFADFVEFERRIRHFKFKFISPESIPFLKYAIISAVLYLALMFVR